MLSVLPAQPSHTLGLSLAVLLLLVPLLATPPAGATAVYTFSTYLGGNNAVGSDRASAVTADGAGNVYVVGATSGSPDFPTTPGVFQETTTGGSDEIWVAKFDPSGTLLVATLVGGSGNDGPLAVAVDAAGAVYVAGTTTSADFPVTPGAIQTVFGGGSDAFVVKLAPDFGSLAYATYLGGSGVSERVSGIAVDGTGHAYVTGQSPSSDFPTTPGAYDTVCGSGGGCTSTTEDVFVAKLDPTGTSLVYSTFLGGSKREFGSAIAIDAAGRAYVTGSTVSSDFPVTAGAFDTTYAGSHDGFVARLSAAGDALEHATYIGGSNSDVFVGIARDAAGDLYLGGYTNSSDFPVTAGAFDTVCGSTSCGNLDAFALKLRLDGSGPIYSTYLGGDRRDFGFGLAVDDDGQLHMAGTTNSPDFPVESPIQGTITSGPACALDAFGIETGPPCSDLWVAKLTADGSALLFSDVVGGTDGESRVAWPSFHHTLALDGTGAVTVAGTSFSTDYPTASAYQAALVGGNDAVVTRLGGLPGSDTVPPTADAGLNQAIHAGDTVVLDGSGSFDDNTATLDLLYQWAFAGTPVGSTAALSGATTASPSFVADLPGTFLVELVVTDEAGLASAPDTVEISSLNVTPVADAGLDRIVVVGDLVALDGSGSSDVDGDPLSYLWTLDAAPAGSLAAVADPTSVTATLEPDLVGAYTVSLTVHDGFVPSAPDTVEITATTAEALAEAKLIEACDLVTALPAGLFDAPGHRNVLCNFMAQAIRQLDDGRLAKAVSKIDDAIERTDGCPLRGAPDPKGAQGADWILGCAAQDDVHALLDSARDALDPVP